MNADEIIRSVRATADSHKTITDFPLEAFPKKMAAIISRMVEYNRYSLDFIGSAILSASATAIGNSRKIRIYGDFIVNPALYMLFVARSGMANPTDHMQLNDIMNSHPNLRHLVDALDLKLVGISEPVNHSSQSG